MSWPLNFFWTVYLGLGLLCFLLERLWPAHKVRYRKALAIDIAACLVYQWPIYGMNDLAGRVTGQFRIDWMSWVYDTPVWARFAFLVLAGDFGAYWFHRLMHTKWAWNVHRFHHSSTELYWLAGVRASAPQQALFNVPYIWVSGLALGLPAYMYFVRVTWEVAHNHFQHVNVAWRSNWLELFYVTPRYHHIHHSAQDHGNYGTKFTMWDRMFGTYVNPDDVKPKKFGTGEDKPRDPVLMMIGIDKLRQPVEIAIAVGFYGFAGFLLAQAGWPSLRLPW